jgi:preprotein translocase subunit Sec61beta
MNPHTAWTQRKREQATRSASACSQAATDVRERIFIAFTGVGLIEYSEQIDLGVLRMEPDRLVFAGTSVTRVIPYGSIVLVGSQPLAGAPDLHVCSVNSTEHLGTQTFICDYPLEYHFGAWYQRWLESAPFTSIDSSDTMAVPPTHR